MTDNATTTERSGMTVREIALMRAIVAWRREPAPRFPRVDHYRRVWRLNDMSPAHGSSVALNVERGLDDDGQGVRIEVGYARDPRDLYRWFEPTSVTEGVDVLVALGFLPARFSSAYAAGFDAAHA